MKNFFFLFFLSFFIFSCKKNVRELNDFTSVEIQSIYEDSMSCRAISIHKNEIWFAANNGKYGAIDLKSNRIFKGKVQNDTIFPEFRSIAITDKGIFILSVANPALLYKISTNKQITELVYKEENEKVFFDSMQFFDENFGIAMGDPVDKCFNVIISNDAGKTWNKIDCDNLPSLEEGEAAFAASNTNLILRENKIFMVSGGKRARCFVSENKGKTWKVYNTPIIQGEVMTGIFTADFYDEYIGIVAGGNYEVQNDNSTNKAITIDGGKTWQLVSKNEGFGYASCIQFVPNGRGKEIVCIGGTGIHYSKNRGKTWQKISEETNLYTFRFLNDSVAYAAGKNKIVQMKFKQ